MTRLSRGVVLLLLAALALLGCPGPEVPAGSRHLEAARAAAEGSSDPDAVGSWLMLELVAPGGRMELAAKARARLKQLKGGGTMAALARALDHDVHGRFPPAAGAYLDALAALRNEARDDSELLGWFITSRLGALVSSVPDLWERAVPLVESAIAAPAGIGWRARSELVEWWSQESYQDPKAPDGEALLDVIADRHGCLREALMAGPFGRGTVGDHRVHFAAEEPGPWPARFAADQAEGRTPRVLSVERHACLLSAAEPVDHGVFYVQTFLDLSAAADVTIAVQGAYAVFVDDVEVLRRDRAAWGVWPRYGVRLRLGAGRHRLLARLLSPDTAIRVLGPTGEPLGLSGSAEQGAPYRVEAPERLEEPNALEPFLRAAGVPAVRGAPRSSRVVDTDHPVLRYIAAYLAHIDVQDDLAGVLIEPLVKDPKRATPVALAQQAVFVDGDPIFAPTVARDLARDIRKQAAERDPELWGPALWLVLERAEKAEPTELVGEMEELARRFPQVPLVTKQLAQLYASLGWKVEHQRTLESAAQLFPRDQEILEALLAVYEQRGRLEQADALAARIRRMDPTSEVAFQRALARRDYRAAIAELERIAHLRKDRRDIALRIADLLVRAGKSSETMSKLEMAVRADPHDAGARLALADARFAGGDRQALTDALVEALRTGSDDSELRAAIELVEGETHLEPYRRDGLAIIADAKARGVELPGTAARILDYAALWIEPDGSARMLEHEIVKIQSREGIARHAEQQLPRGMVLRMRTIKSDGRIFEPEIVADKPTVTMPHLEVGDYVETESIWVLPNRSGGRSFRAPRWYFREENTSYHLSELVVIAPASRPLDVETTGAVPEPEVEQLPGLTVRRWRVEGSIALPEEPLSAPMQEFLPSVQVGWGIELEPQLVDFIRRQSNDQLRDPRMVRIARSIVAGKVIRGAPRAPEAPISERARRIYRWVLETIEPGDERDPAKIISGKSGDRTLAFLYLCRLAGIDARLGLVRDRLSPPARGPFSEADTYNVPAVRLATEKGSRWLVLVDRFAPFGFLPSSLRGQPAALIQTARPITTTKPPPIEREVTSSEGADSGIRHEGEVTLAADGSAEMKLTQRYRGRFAIQLRSALNNIPESRRRDVVEAQLLGLALPGGRITDLSLPNLDRLDEPIALSMDVQTASFARPVHGGELLLEVPFLGSLAPLVQLPSRETPLYISERVATRSHVVLRIRLPKGARVVSDQTPFHVEDPRLVAHIADRVEGSVLIVERSIEVPAGRIQPEAYPEFKELVTRADAALNRSVRIVL